MAQFGIDVQGVKGTIPGDFKLKDLSALRPIILNKGLTIVNQMAPPLFAEVANFSDSCPNPERLQQIIEKRNNIVEQANQIASFLSTIMAALTLASTILGTIITIIKVVKGVKGIVQKIAAFIPISPGAIPSGIGIVGDALNDAVTKADGSPRIVPIKESIDGLLIPLGIVIAAIAALVAALSGLDGAITGCVTPAPNPNAGSNGAGGNGGGGGGNDNPMGDILRGPILSVTIEDPGKNYENGTYDDVKLIGGDGSGAKATIKVSGNEVKKVTITEGGQGYSKQLFDPKKGFQNPNYLTVKPKKLGKIKFNADELLETVDLKKKIVKKLEKQKVVGEGLLMSVKEIGASEDSGGNTTGNLNASSGPNGTNIVDNNNETGQVVKLKVTKKGGGYDNGIFENIPLEGGNGNGLTASITIENGRIKSALRVNAGDGYKKSDTFTLPSNIANSNSTGIGGILGVDLLGATGTEDGSNEESGGVGELSISSKGENYIDGSYKDVKLQGGEGEGITADLNIEGGSITSARTTNAGNGYKKGDKFTLPLDYLANQIISTDTGANLSNQGIGKGNNEGTLSTSKNALLSSARIAEDFSAFSVISLPQSFTSGEGEGATFNLKFTGDNGAATLTEVTVANPGSGYSSGDTITITNFDLSTAGGVTSGFIGPLGTGDLVFTVTPNSLNTPVDTSGGDQGKVGQGSGGVNVPIGAGNGVGAEVSVASITPSSENSKIVNTNTGLVTSTPLTDQEYATKEEKLIAVLAGGPLLVEGPDGEVIELPGLTILDPALTQIARGAQEAANTANESSYKGFILDIETRQFSSNLIQRRAIAINPSGVVEVTTEFSFATAEDVLIEDLKLIIDELDLRADYTGVDLGDRITSVESEVALPRQ